MTDPALAAARLWAAALEDSPWIHCPECGGDVWLLQGFASTPLRCAECGVGRAWCRHGWDHDGPIDGRVRLWRDFRWLRK